MTTHHHSDALVHAAALAEFQHEEKARASLGVEPTSWADLSEQFKNNWLDRVRAGLAAGLTPQPVYDEEVLDDLDQPLLPREQVRKNELRHILEPWRDSTIGRTRCEIYCRTFLGQELDTALAEGIAGGWVWKEERRFLENPHPDRWDISMQERYYYWWLSDAPRD